MFARIVKHHKCDNPEKYIDHYIKLLIDNSEIVKLLENANAPKGVVVEIFSLDNCCIDRNYRYYDKYGNYWNNWIGKEIVVDL